jgi:hypothetical protein
LMNTHYINTRAEPLETEARINLYTVPYDDVETEAGVLFFYNPLIHVPAQSTGRARMRCEVTSDIEVMNVQSHMHKLGNNYQANLLDADSGMVKELYKNTLWENVPIGRFAPTQTITAGQSVDYWCDYENYTSDDVYQGATTKDEMCMFIGPYWPRDDAMEVCENADGDFDATFIGDGNVSCGDTYGCVLTAIDGPDDDLLDRVSVCMANACEQVAEPASEVLLCFALTDDCEEQCGDDGEGCTTCLLTACAPEVEACGAAPACDG